MNKTISEVTKVKQGGNVGIGTTTPTTMITVRIGDPKEFKRIYSLRARIGMRLLWLIGVLSYEK